MSVQGTYQDTYMVMKQVLSAYDGKAISLLTELAVRVHLRPDYMMTLIALMGRGEGHVSDGATYLIKRALEEGAHLDDDQMDALLANLPALSAWQAILHMCQSVRLLTLMDEHADPLAEWLAGHLDHARPFIRAWSVDGLCHIGERFPAHHARAFAALEAARADDAASVRARVRNLSPGSPA